MIEIKQDKEFLFNVFNEYRKSVTYTSITFELLLAESNIKYIQYGSSLLLNV